MHTCTFQTTYGFSTFEPSRESLDMFGRFMDVETLSGELLAPIDGVDETLRWHAGDPADNVSGQGLFDRTFAHVNLPHSSILAPGTVEKSVITEGMWAVEPGQPLAAAQRAARSVRARAVRVLNRTPNAPAASSSNSSSSALNSSASVAALAAGTVEPSHLEEPRKKLDPRLAQPYPTVYSPCSDFRLYLKFRQLGHTVNPAIQVSDDGQRTYANYIGTLVTPLSH
jgi:hypothetical protein